MGKAIRPDTPVRRRGNEEVDGIILNLFNKPIGVARSNRSQRFGFNSRRCGRTSILHALSLTSKCGRASRRRKRISATLGVDPPQDVEPASLATCTIPRLFRQDLQLCLRSFVGEIEVHVFTAPHMAHAGERHGGSSVTIAAKRWIT